MYEQGLAAYLKQLEIAKFINGSSPELATIYASLAQTYLDLSDFQSALLYYQLEMDTNTMSAESEAVSLLNVAAIKERLHVGVGELKEVYLRAYGKAQEAGKVKLQLRVMRGLREVEMAGGVDGEETRRVLEEIKRMGGETSESSGEEGEEEEEEEQSIVFSSESRMLVLLCVRMGRVFQTEW